ncbi:hypothetical protein AB8O38_18700, partial [Saccharomonospora xinjiangensis]|uniref:hypothetical protein n=1 Tax=Saccharomonospora xinjiangensis TaxID=75294 RepID=UPI00350F42B6
PAPPPPSPRRGVGAGAPGRTHLLDADTGWFPTGVDFPGRIVIDARHRLKRGYAAMATSRACSWTRVSRHWRW